MPLLARWPPPSSPVCDQPSVEVGADNLGVPRFGALLSNDHLGGLIRFDHVSQQTCLDEEALRELCDAARAALVDGYLPDVLAKRLTDFLAAVVTDETYGIATIDFPVLMHTRLDKLVAEMSTLPPDALDPSRAAKPRRHDSTGRRLQRFWRARFRRDYFDIDQMRYADLSRDGRLRHVVFDHDQLWRAIACQALSNGPVNLQFEAGD
ncbi:hypothetical protein XA68_10565 [Ophiocordyceps unilateralis]|uniref:Uncharacterized protein n=1 Tax=Ophiocordyceps unilateralis TaxID=268505 RepID=A0A2A9PIE1_OPHUN|nr:hypothetical protein XA68_10565 [Ophiocordyceps unilateralis]